MVPKAYWASLKIRLQLPAKLSSGWVGELNFVEKSFLVAEALDYWPSEVVQNSLFMTKADLFTTIKTIVATLLDKWNQSLIEVIYLCLKVNYKQVIDCFDSFLHLNSIFLERSATYLGSLNLAAILRQYVAEYFV